MKSLGLTLALLLFAGVVAEGQILKRLGKRVKRKVEERVERKTDEAVDKGLDKVEDAAEGKDGEKEGPGAAGDDRSEEHTSELQSLMRISYAVFCLKKKHRTRTV